MNDSIPLIEELYRTIEDIAHNTEPVLIYGINIRHLASWSFLIAICSLVVGGIAAWYSYKGYKFQKISADHLESLVPGQMSYYEVVGNLLSNIISVEAIYFGKQSYKSFPVKLILSIAKLPDDLIQLEKYEKKQNCFDEAFKLKISWQNYNNFIDSLIEYSAKNENKKALRIAQFIIDLSKSEIRKIQTFENTLLLNKYLMSKTTSNEKISYYLMNRFFEYIKNLECLEIKKMDCSRSNLSKHTKTQYTFTPYLPNIFNMEKYLEEDHKNRLSGVGEEYDALLSYNPETIIASIKRGELDYLGNYLILPSNVKFSDIDYRDFKSAYFNYIEPILIGFKRKEYLSFLLN